MTQFNEQQFNGKVLDHLGLVADKIAELNLVQLIDERLPVSAAKGAKLSMGERVSAMILNGLGFVNTRLYMFPQFLQNKPIKRLFNKELEASYFNDDALGRCLDDIEKYGTTKLFTELSFAIGTQKNLLGRSANFDTSTLQLYGEYAEDGLPTSTPQPRQGFSKSKRHDLKQMVINLATTGKANFPIWMEAHSGNSSDKTIMPDAVVKMTKLCQSLQDTPSFLYVGDSAMYSNILQHSKDIKWLSRVPENILQAKQLIRQSESNLSWQELDDGYSYHVAESDHNDVKQRWILIYSSHAFTRETKTLDKNIKKIGEELQKKFWHLSNEGFSCTKDATVALKKLSKKMPYHQVTTKIVELTKHSKKGRPSTGDKPTIVGYKIEFELKEDQDKIEAVRLTKGRFILATNEFDVTKLPDADVLSEYKSQSGTEKSFKFIKDDTFEIDSVFLKNPGRISALMMIMTLCLMVYGVSEYDLRTAFKKSKRYYSRSEKQTNGSSKYEMGLLFI